MAHLKEWWTSYSSRSIRINISMTAANQIIFGGGENKKTCSGRHKTINSNALTHSQLETHIYHVSRGLWAPRHQRRCHHLKETSPFCHLVCVYLLPLPLQVPTQSALWKTFPCSSFGLHLMNSQSCWELGCPVLRAQTLRHCLTRIYCL